MGMISSSHPSRVRGLKFAGEFREFFGDVAPFTGAWIEICLAPHQLFCSPGRTLHGCVD